MAVTLTGAADARLDFGVGVLGTFSPGAITVAFTINISTLADRRMVSKWAGFDLGQTFLVQSVGNQIAWAALSRVSGNHYHAYQTSDAPLTTGTNLRIVVRIDLSGVVSSCWVNGSARASGVWFGGGSPGDVLQGQGLFSLQVGHETGESLDGVDGVYSEIAIWTEYVPDWVARAYGLGFSPAIYRSNAHFYCPAWSTSELRDQWGGHHGTNTGGTNAAHPPVIYPGESPVVPYGAPSGGGGGVPLALFIHHYRQQGIM